MLLLLWAGLLLADLPEEAGETARIERAVVDGSVARLAEFREAIEDRLESTGDSLQRDRYLLAYVQWRMSQPAREGAKKENGKLLRQAQAQLQRYLKTSPADAEGHALLGGVIGQRITGTWKGMTLGPKASRALKRAYELAPDNPRVALQRGVSFWFTPKTFGGGKQKAEDELRRAVALFGDESAAKSWPNWGRVDSLAWLGHILAQQQRTAEARQLYERALAIEPTHAWIRQELLPELARR